MRGDIEIMLGLQTVMKMMIEEIQADNKEKEQDLLARLTGLLVKGPPLEGTGRTEQNRRHHQLNHHHHQSN